MSQESKKPFVQGNWNTSVDVRDFVLKNIRPYYGDGSFLCGPSERTKRLWEHLLPELQKERNNGGVLEVDTDTISNITSHKAGYIDRENEVIVGLQTDKALRRAIKPFGGVRLVEGACREHGLELSERVKDIFRYAKDHNTAVFSVYDSQIRRYRSLGMLTGLPDNYARGRIIGDYRRMALYGIDRLIEEKKKDFKKVDISTMSHRSVRLREELSMQIQALEDMKEMGAMYGLDLARPAENGREAVQWVYMAYLAGAKEQDGAAMSLGNVSSFLDIYLERDIEDGTLTEEGAQEIIDQFVMKLRIIRHLRPASYDDIFGGDPTWVTESIGGMLHDGRTKVTKTSFRFLQTLYNLGPSPEPNLTVLWSEKLPEGFKKFCAQVSIDTSSVQYENDDLMRSVRGSDDYGIACCVSYQEVGKRIQHFGARCNLAKTLLVALNAGRDENKGLEIVEGIEPMPDGRLDYDQVMARFRTAMREIAKVYAKTMYLIHYMHDKYYYERAQMSFVDSWHGIDVAYGAAGISIVADSLSAIKYADVRAVRNEEGLTTGFEIKGDFPKYGNDDDRVDDIAREVAKEFFMELKKHKTYKGANPTLSLLTITSNVVYGKKTGATPDGREAGVPFAPGANPMHGRDCTGAVASLNSVAKLDYNYSMDGISNTFTIVPKSLGSSKDEQVENLVGMMTGYFSKMAHHLNVNVLNRETLMDAYEHPEKYPQLTIRVSGYAVNFVRLSRAHQAEVISRTFHESM